MAVAGVTSTISKCVHDRSRRIPRTNHGRHRRRESSPRLHRSSSRALERFCVVCSQALSSGRLVSFCAACPHPPPDLVRPLASGLWPLASSLWPRRSTSNLESRMTHARAQIRFLVFHASLRVGSHNDQLATLAAKCIERLGGMVDRASMTEFDCPSYDLDVERDE